MRLLLGVTLLLVVLAWLAATAVRASGQQRPLMGTESMIGTLGIARTDIAPEGQVEVMGARWRAQAKGAPIAQGSTVRISSTLGLMLIVEPPDADGVGPAAQAQGRSSAGGRST
jgi:membrane-bound serine protease (ClpP class)